MNKELSGCYVVTFYNKLREDAYQYQEIANRMFDLAKQQAGYIGIESVRNEDGIGITISYWKTLQDIHNWKNHTDHLLAQQYGIKVGYEWYHLTVSKISYHRSFNQK